MDGIYEMAASPMPAVVGGTTYLLGQLTASDDGLIEQRILTERRKPADVLAEFLPKLEGEDRRALLEIAWKDEVRGPRVPYAEVRSWLLTERGQVFRMWLMLKHHQPDTTLEQAGAIYRQALAEYGQKAMREAAEASGAELGNSSAPAPAGAANQATASPGGRSSGNSAKTTAGHPNKSGR